MELNKGTVADIRLGLMAGRFVVPTVEAGTLLVQGVAHSGLARFTGDPGAASNVTIAQQLCQLVLRGFGVPPADADQVAALATDEVLRRPRAPLPQEG